MADQVKRNVVDRQTDRLTDLNPLIVRVHDGEEQKKSLNGMLHSSF